MSVPLLLLCCGHDIIHVGTDDNGAVRFRSLLTNLRKLTLRGVAVSLPALQPVATRLHQLDLTASCLHGSSDGFLTRGWTALTTLSLAEARVENVTVTAAFELPALEELDIISFRHQGGVLQLDQLTGSCPNIRKLRIRVDNDLARGREGRAPCCSLMSLGRLADLYMEIFTEEPINADLNFDLPASLMRFEVEGVCGGDWVFEFFWALREAMKCVRRGAQLHRMMYMCIGAPLQPAQWGASLDEQYRRLGGQLSSLRELEVWGESEPLRCALSAVVSSAPSLTRVTFGIIGRLPHMELPAICSASLETFIVDVTIYLEEPPLPAVVLTFLPGCTRLQQALVRIGGAPTEGHAVKIRCHSASPTCIVPLGVHEDARARSEVGVRFLPGPPSPQGVQSYTVLCACHAAGPQQPLKWGHVVMRGVM